MRQLCGLAQRMFDTAIAAAGGGGIQGVALTAGGVLLIPVCALAALALPPAAAERLSAPLLGRQPAAEGAVLAPGAPPDETRRPPAGDLRARLDGGPRPPQGSGPADNGLDTGAVSTPSTPNEAVRLPAACTDQPGRRRA